MTGVYVKAVGSAEEVLYLSRVPTIGEHVTVCGLPRRVAVVLHHLLDTDAEVDVPLRDFNRQRREGIVLPSGWNGANRPFVG